MKSESDHKWCYFCCLAIAYSLTTDPNLPVYCLSQVMCTVCTLHFIFPLKTLKSGKHFSCNIFSQQQVVAQKLKSTSKLRKAQANGGSTAAATILAVDQSADYATAVAFVQR